MDNFWISKIEPFIAESIEKSKVSIERRKLALSHNRFDIAFKIFYLECLEGNKQFAQEVYKSHIKALSLGTYKEYGNAQKNGIEAFLRDFNKIYEDIKTNGFDEKKSIIPLASDGSLLNGAHRASCAMCLNVDVVVAQTNHSPLNYNYEYFKNRGVPEDFLDIAALKFLEHSKNCYAALVWPNAIGKDKEIENLLGRIVYKKSIMLNYNGAHNLLAQVYLNESWLGERSSNYPGAERKLLKCFNNKDQLRVYLFQSNSLNDVLEIKNDIRKIFNIGKHSIHIADTQDESKKIGSLLLNKNGVHFLNNAKPNKYESTHKNLSTFHRMLLSESKNYKNFVLDSGMVLSIYGIREALDIDFITLTPPLSFTQNTDNHQSEIVFHKNEPENIILNQNFHFEYLGTKFVSLHQVAEMKKNRGHNKDKIDLALIIPLLKKENFFLLKIKYEFIFIKIKILENLNRFWIYKKMKSIYRNKFK